MTPAPIECNEALGASGFSVYEASNGDRFIGDAFGACEKPQLWNRFFGEQDEGDFTWLDRGRVESDGTSVTTTIEIALGFPESESATLDVSMDAEALFHTPSAPHPESSRVPAKLLFEVARDGTPLGGYMSAIVRGPGVERIIDLDALADGLHEVDALLHPGATYELGVHSFGALDVVGSGSQTVTASVLVPEPAGALLAMAGAAALAAVRLGRRR
jgi:hypothetical protein